ncbi:hypothetical protein CAP35_01565 [Chitinophagaceae bacterium IBVUCB1]|nr:hypothetical protein CAP35_01565 [Chitinophagaceae bacterium IBVUCB1]
MFKVICYIYIDGVSKEYYLPDYGFNNKKVVERGKECNHLFGKNNLIKEIKTFIRNSIPLILYAFGHYRLSLILPSKPEQDLE